MPHTALKIVSSIIALPFYGGQPALAASDSSMHQGKASAGADDKKLIGKNELAPCPFLP